MDTPLIIFFVVPLDVSVLFSSLHMSGINYLSKQANASFSGIALHIKDIGVMIYHITRHVLFFENVPYYQSSHIADLSFLDTTTIETFTDPFSTYTPLHTST